jgi:hypothetical protein
LAIDPSTPTTLYAALAYYGVYKSSDGGNTWSAINTGLPAATGQDNWALAINPQNTSILYVGADNMGLYESTNGGATWTAASTGLPANANVATIAIDPKTPLTIYVGVYGAASGVYKSTNGGGAWSASGTGIAASTDIRTLTINPQTTSTLFAGVDDVAGVTTGGVYESSNGGASWSLTSAPQPGAAVHTLVFDPVTLSTIYVGYWYGGIYRSPDGGTTWAAFESGLTDLTIHTIVIAQTNPLTIYAGSCNSGVFSLQSGTGPAFTVAVSPTAIAGGYPATGTFALNNTSGGSATLSSGNTLVATAPSAVTVLSGSSSEPFTVNTVGVTTPTYVPISATYLGTVRATNLLVTPAISSVVLNPSSVVGGNGSSATVSLTGAAPENAVVSLSSSNSTVASVPATVTFTAGATSVIVPVTTTTVSTSQSPTITAVYNGSSGNSTLTVGPANNLTSFTPSSLTFASQPVGTPSAPKTFTLTNTGNTNLTITGISVTGSNAGDFTQTNNCVSPLAPGGVCTFDVTFAPAGILSRTASVSIADSAPGSPQSVALTGTGTAPIAATSPSSWAFGSRNVGTTSSPWPFTLSNLGNVPLTISGIAITGVNPGDFGQTGNCGSSVAAGGNCTINVTFTPTSTGTRAATLTVTDNSNNVAGSQQPMSLTGAGMGSLTITASSASMPYGGTVPAITPSYSGFVGGDTAASLTTPPTCSTTALNNSPVGSYPSTCTSAVDPNYSITYVAGAVGVSPAPLTITAPSVTSSVGSTLPTFTPTYSGFVLGQSSGSLTTPPNCSTTATTSSPAGNYPITCPGAVDSNYNISYVAGILTLNPAVTSSGTATFVTLDTTTQGNWKGVYGSNGYNVINNAVSYPAYVTVTPSGTNAFTWASSSTDVRALLQAASGTNRIAATWYSSSSMLIDLVFNDGQQHQVAIYCLDWDSTIRTETVAVQDATGVLLNTQNVSNFNGGQYLVWQLSGHVQIHVTTTSSTNAVISGLFFDTTGLAGSYTLTGPAGGALNTASASFTVTPNGAYNGTITITPSGGGLSTPVTLTFSNSAAAQTFTITPTVVGPVTLTASNNGSLTNPAALTYATPPGAPTIGAATAGTGSATVSFTPPGITGGASITGYTATCGSQSVSGAASPITVTGLSSGTAYTCTVTAINAEGISAPSAPSNSVTPNAVAGSYTLTGPAGGALNTASASFTVTPNGAYNGTITITPSGGGLSTPVTLTFSNSAAAQTFTITPTVAGPVTLTASNNGSLTNPAALTYATPPGAPTIGTATAGTGSATVSFTPPGITGGASITGYTATCGSQSVSGAASPITVTGLSGGTAYTCTVTAINAEGISAPSAASNSVTPNGVAGSYTLTGPAGGALNTASASFTVTPNGAYNGTITITPSGGGLSTPVTLTFSNSAAAQTFTITPTVAGPVTLTPSNNGSLTNPAALTYATPPGAPTIGAATAGTGSATVSFTPGITGGASITGYTATCGSQSVGGAASPITVTGLSSGTAYTCTVTATNAEGISAPSAASNSVTPAVPATTGTATFVTLDTTTQGNWKGVYGSNGYNVINNAVSYPAYVTVTPSGTNAFTWASSSTDVRALLQAASGTNRIAATWYSSSSMLIDLVFNDGQQHQVAIYCLDWDTTKRTQRIDILDTNGVVLNTQNVSNFYNGEYMVWTLSGHVQIRVTNTNSSANAVTSGVFFR